MAEDVPDDDTPDDTGDGPDDAGSGDAYSADGDSADGNLGDADDASSDSADPQRIYRRKVEPDPDEPYLSFLHTIAEVEGCSIDDLPPLYDYVDHLVEHLFSTPPPAKAQVQMEFTYYNYRVNLDQEGNLSLMKQSEPLELDG